jgi:hypothetical protein
MNAKAVAAATRTAIRTATRTAGDPLHGLTVSVRTRYASQMSAVDVVVTGGVTDEDLHLPRDERAPGKFWTERARAITDRLHELAVPIATWRAGNDRMRFGSISFDGGLAPDPRQSHELPAHTAAADTDTGVPAAGVGTVTVRARPAAMVQVTTTAGCVNRYMLIEGGAEIGDQVDCDACPGRHAVLDLVEIGIAETVTVQS